MSDVVGIGQALRAAFGNGPPLDLSVLAARAEAALAAVATQPHLHPMMRATLAQLCGADNAAKLDAAVVAARSDPDGGPELDDAPHGAGHALLYEYDAAEQARFEAECARELAGETDG